tara:strand:- start:46 stop:219 length:174 start_codon:yes stop_codon:yes gene_type:complete
VCDSVENNGSIPTDVKTIFFVTIVLLVLQDSTPNAQRKKKQKIREEEGKKSCNKEAS